MNFYYKIYDSVVIIVLICYFVLYLVKKCRCIPRFNLYVMSYKIFYKINYKDG
jgi:hypothetical protein